VPSFGCPWGFNLCYNKCTYPAVPDWNPSDTTNRLAGTFFFFYFFSTFFFPYKPVPDWNPSDNTKLLIGTFFGSKKIKNL
jgi:hypothetical protein